MKQELIKKIKDILIDNGGMLMPDVETYLGDVYTVTYNELCDGVEVDVIMERGQGIEHPSTATVDIEYLHEKDIEKILEALMTE
jgi:hypothetical protein